MAKKKAGLPAKKAAPKAAKPNPFELKTKTKFEVTGKRQGKGSGKNVIQAAVMRQDGDLAGFVHGAEVVEPTQLSNVVHSATLWPPEQPAPPRVKRTVIIYLMQSFSGQGRGVGRSIVHALREGGVSTQNPTIQRHRALPSHQQPQHHHHYQQQEVDDNPDRLTSVQILQELLNERSTPQNSRSVSPEPERGQENGMWQHQEREEQWSRFEAHDSRNGSSRSDENRNKQQENSEEEWLVLADAPMENARPFWHKMGVPVAIESSYVRDAWMDLGWHASSEIRVGNDR